MSSAPVYCRPSAYDLFARQLPTIEETASLVRAAVAVSMHQLEDVDPEAVEKNLAEIAVEIAGRVCSGSQQALVAQLHEVLFEEWGFTGNTLDYYSAENSYLPRVLETRRGIPVTLSLVYKSVAQLIGLNARGINAPAHFLAAVEVDNSWMIVDPFQGGRVLTPQEVQQRLEQWTATKLESTTELLPTATHPEWLARLIRNLEQNFQRADQQDHMLAMRELLALLGDS